MYQHKITVIFLFVTKRIYEIEVWRIVKVIIYHTSQNRKKTLLLCTLMGKSTIALICKKKKRVNDKVETNLANVSNLKIWKNTISKCA